MTALGLNRLPVPVPVPVPVPAWATVAGLISSLSTLRRV
jgi:hypothetical protein